MVFQTHYLYPVVIEQTESNLSMYFPDFPGAAVTAVDLVEGLARAKELLAFRIVELEETGQPLPDPSAPEKIELEEASDRIVFLEVFIPPYRDAAANKAVTKNCTLPKWLRDEGDKAGLNFSLILQNGLKDALGLAKHDHSNNERAAQ
ncbi:type II toxin-antitoxin system HicB family antitoxin [Paenibacillus hemerocallicola]|uniref:Type II toxin-antitoxin system HicB family antitoxin n=1 Tax=Paenibacillus hemerocallicola TaxID=1172614 RepID=A0A5C4T6G4_9BACL|nr:type II toxin-antitoxin system HicB family antitoxin [Paenibacillus hemerocallicola]TNJ64240.1 type II toxin-antitoxin system HicB family antitoxin [Paenibacillus hemerocallicola]